VSESIISNIVLTVVGSSCADAVNAFDLDVYEQQVVDAAVDRSVVLTRDQVTATIAGCRASSRRLAAGTARRTDAGDVIVDLLVTITSLSSGEQEDVRPVVTATAMLCLCLNPRIGVTIGPGPLHIAWCVCVLVCTVVGRRCTCKCDD
jgi:hypothetical protein